MIVIRSPGFTNGSTTLPTDIFKFVTANDQKALAVIGGDKSAFTTSFETSCRNNDLRQNQPWRNVFRLRFTSPPT
jgi:hypothetical protein